MKWIAAIAIAVAACSDSPSAPDAAFQPAAHPGFAAGAIPKQSGPVIPHPRLVTVTFAGFEHEAAVQAFGSWLPTSSWLAMVGAEYGIGAGSDLGHVVLSQAAPSSASVADVGGFLANLVRSGALPASTDASIEAGYIYVVYYPPTTTVHVTPGDAGCAAAGGFHAAYSDGSLFFAYAAIPSSCAALAAPLGISPLEFITFDASHEIVEAASDPYVVVTNGTAVAAGTAAWEMTDQTNPWFAFGGEIGDACTAALVHADSYTVTRVWSNAAANAGDDPCVPPAGPYFGVSPGDDRPTIAAGSSMDLALVGWSSAAVAPWKLVAATGPFVTSSFVPTASVTPGQFNNGTTGNVSVGVPAGTPSGAKGVVFLVSDPTSSDPPIGFSSRKIWPVLVTAR